MPEEQENQTNPMIVVYLVLSVIVAIIFATMDTKDTIGFGFWSRLFVFILAAPGAFIGAMIGDVIRKAAIPDGFITSGGLFAILKEKLFWFIGPQLIGMVVGGAVGATIVTKIVA